MVTVLRLAYEYDCESQLGAELLRGVLDGKLPDIKTIQARFLRPSGMANRVSPPPHALADRLITAACSGGDAMTNSIALLLKELHLPAFGRHYAPVWEIAAEKG